MALDGQCVIDTAEAMNVTFPSFVELMTSLGAKMKCE
jgi:5-enolpyruvylshikimate-3-phosphate synthase